MDNSSLLINLNANGTSYTNMNRSLMGMDPAANLKDALDRIRRENILKNLALSMVFSLIMLISLFGNSLVIYVIIRKKRMHTVTNAFIVNLAVADLLITCLNIPFNIIRFIVNGWLFGDVMCHAINYVQMISVYAFTFTLVIIGLDRYRVILYPFKPRISMKMAILFITLIWILSSILAIPFGLYYSQITFVLLRETRCTKQFPSDEVEGYIYLYTTVAQYIIPLFIITITYGRIIAHLWSRKTLGFVTRDQQAQHNKSKKRTVKMLITVVLAFAALWMPLNVYYLIIHFPPPGTKVKPSGKTVFSCYWVAVFSVCVNPFIYCWYNNAFRVEMINRVRCCFREKWRLTPGYEMDGMLLKTDTRSSRRNDELHDQKQKQVPKLEVTPPEHEERLLTTPNGNHKETNAEVTIELS